MRIMNPIKVLLKADWSVPTKVNAFVSTKQHDVDAYLQQKKRAVATTSAWY